MREVSAVAEATTGDYQVELYLLHGEKKSYELAKFFGMEFHSKRVESGNIFTRNDNENIAIQNRTKVIVSLKTWSGF